MKIDNTILSLRASFMRLALTGCLALAMTACCDHHGPGGGEPDPGPGPGPGPAPAPKPTLCLKLSFDTNLPQWKHEYTTRADQPIGGDAKVVQTTGNMRCVVRATPATGVGAVKTFVFNRSVAEGYDCYLDMDLPFGDYDLMVWSDLQERQSQAPFYNVDNFAQIVLSRHQGNTDYRDAFRGTRHASWQGTSNGQNADTLNVQMQRPLAKYELVSTDLARFMMAEQNNALLREKQAKEADTRAVNLADYKVVLSYPGYMPDTYSMVTDKPVDSAKGMSFASQITRLNANEASLGFDYVFVNGHEGVVTVQIGLYDKQGALISTSKPIDVPLLRSRHTIMRGEFLTQQASGGLNINPAYSGDFNIAIP